MLEALVVTLREGLEAALVLGLILVYLRRIGRVDLARFAYAGLVLAIAASGLGAYVFQALNLGEEVTDIVEAYIMLIGAFFVGTMVVWMFKASRSLRRQVEHRIDAIAGKRTALTQGLSLLLLAFVMVFREGAETILFLAALSLGIGSNPFLIATGGALGLGLAAVLGVLIIKGLVRINLRLFFGGTGLVLLALVATLVANAMHNFAEFDFIRLTPNQLSLIGLFTREDTSVFILTALVAVPALLITFDPLITRGRREPESESPAQRRLRAAEARRSKMLRSAVGGLMTVIVVIVGASWAPMTRGGYDPVVVPINPQGGRVAIPLSELGDGSMHKYAVEVRGATVRFFAIQPEGEPARAALDVCYICPPAGYYLKEESVVCKNCDAPINFDTIGLSGGCNPRVLGFRLDGSSLVVDAAELEASARYFGKG